MPKPAAANNVDKFLSRLEKSDLLTPEQLGKIRDIAAGHQEVKALARYLIKQDLLTQWQAEQLLAGGQLFKLGKYRLLRQLSSGEHGRIFLAEHAAMGRRVALRTLPRRSAERPELVKRFLAEAAAAAAIDHRNIVHVYDVNSEGDRYYVVMEYVEGRSLSDMVEADGPLSPTQAADYIRQAAAGLAHAHREGVVHREVNPGKLLVDEQGIVKIREMGISGLDEPSESASTDISGGATSAGAYLAPEQCQSAPRADERTDVYALGAVLYYLLSGKSPLAASGSDKPQDLLQLRSDVPESLVTICGQMLATDPAQRPASAKELERSLEQWLAQQRPAAPPVRRKGAAETPSAGVTPAAGVPAAKPAPPKKGMKVAQPLEETPAESAVPNFGASAKPAAGSKATKAAKATAPPAEGDVTPKQGPPVALILGVAGGGVALLLLLVGGGLWYAFSGKQEVAVTNPTTPAEVVAPVPTDPSEDKKPAEELVEDKQPEEPAPEPKKEEEEPRDLSDVLNLGKEPKPEPMPPDQPTPNENEPAPETPTEAPEPKPEPKPNPEPKPEPKPAPKVNPFAELATRVNLPSLGEPGKPNPEAANPFTLGKVQADGAIVFINLVGGEKTGKGKPPITLQNANGGTSEREWEFSITDPRTNTSLMIATMALNDDALVFQWAQGALDNPPLAEGLVNCALSMSASGNTHRLVLRELVAVQPIVVTLDSIVKPEVDLPNLPDPDAVKVEFTKVEGATLKTQFDKTQIIPADRGTTLLTFGETTEQKMLYLKFDTTLRRGLTIAVTPFYKLAPEAPAKRFVKSDVEKLALQANAQREVVSNTIQQLKAQKSENAKKQVSVLEPQMELFNQGIKRLEEMGAQYQALNNIAQIHFRVVYQPNETETIELAVSSVPVDAVPMEENVPEEGKLRIAPPKEE